MKLSQKQILLEAIKIKQNEIDLLKLELSQKEKAITFLNENLRMESNLKEKYKSINQINLNAYEELRAIIDNDDLQYGNTETTKKIKKLESDIIRKDKFIKEGFYKNQKQINNLIAENNDLKKQKEYKWIDTRIDLKKENSRSTEYSEFWSK